SSDVNNCGACGNACTAPANATAVCSSGRCGYACLSSYGDCDGNAANGCEAALNTAANCGACGNACAGANPDCCPSGSSAGGYACTNTYQDAANCGSCGQTCDSGTCSNGICCVPDGDTCTADYMCCSGLCDRGFGQCANCIPDGHPCTQNSDCCVG